MTFPTENAGKSGLSFARSDTGMDSASSLISKNSGRPGVALCLEKTVSEKEDGREGQSHNYAWKVVDGPR